MKKTKIMVVIEGGIVQRVMATNPELVTEFVVLDCDRDSEEEVVITSEKVLSVSEKEWKDWLSEE